MGIHVLQTPGGAETFVNVVDLGDQERGGSGDPDVASAKSGVLRWVHHRYRDGIRTRGAIEVDCRTVSTLVPSAAVGFG
ncbi:hypothetical protein EP51_39980 (plasmid) [Rhodococcus opacus]|uniref:Uncharacterized protein n=1 Tax=Rhodococcus opacus TaxID=37919 RepID=A0A076EWV4_RHOOP|nr:hypothetical protein EP51_39980 [Rhodococcus opacus]